MDGYLTGAAASTEEARIAPSVETRFPPIVWQKNRGYIRRGDLEYYKSSLIAAALGGAKQPEIPRAEYDILVSLKQVAAELGVGRRTIGRRIAEAKAETVT